MTVKNEKHLTSNVKTKKPVTTKSPNGGKKPFSVKGLPTPSWTEKQLVEGARFQWKELQAAEKKAAVHVFRLGAALILLKSSLKKRRSWGKFLKDLHISEATAWRATELFMRAKTEDQVAFLTITEAYEKFGIIHCDIPADKDGGEDNAAETGNKKNAVAIKAAAKIAKAKKTSPRIAAYEEIEVQGDDLEDDTDGERKQDDDRLISLAAGLGKLPRFALEDGGKDEFYTPDNVSSLILPYLPKGKVIWEYAWGLGHMARYLQSQGYTVLGDPDLDFLKEYVEADLNVSNPPFSKKDEFLRRAYDIGKPFAMLLPADALIGLERYPLFAKHGLQLLIPNKRINFIRVGGSSANFNTFWLCWKLLPQDIIFAELPPNGQGGVQ